MDKEKALFWDVLAKRSSVRRYKETPVPQEMLDALLEAMKLAPVAGGNRNVVCQIVSDTARIQSIADNVKRICAESMDAIPDAGLKKEALAYSKSFYWFAKVPTLLVISCRKTPPYMSLLVPKGTEDLFGAKASAAMAVQNIMLAAAAMGLGSCCLTGPLFAKAWLEKELECPKQNELVFLITLGFPAKSFKDSGEPPAEAEAP